MSDRDELAAALMAELERQGQGGGQGPDEGWDAPYVDFLDPEAAIIDGRVNLPALADAILARWRLVPVEGECVCDREYTFPAPDLIGCEQHGWRRVVQPGPFNDYPRPYPPD